MTETEMVDLTRQFAPGLTIVNHRIEEMDGSKSIHLKVSFAAEMFMKVDETTTRKEFKALLRENIDRLPSYLVNGLGDLTPGINP